ncbi:hypothetical protein E2C01_089721 [Portunus trituberculatus]|uniref:Uncharacterized protein n=1 Tax=Portunus trituberculatus TaxID=210409 RepID=A0A5B7JN77_PORTR|nr:hypothetical protein [Portunus trituberculatus]
MGTEVMVCAVSRGSTGGGRVGLSTCIFSANTFARSAALSSLLEAVVPSCLVKGGHALLPHHTLPLLDQCPPRFISNSWACELSPEVLLPVFVSLYLQLHIIFSSFVFFFLLFQLSIYPYNLPDISFHSLM